MVVRHSIAFWVFIFRAPRLFFTAYPIFENSSLSLFFLRTCYYGFVELYLSLELLILCFSVCFFFSWMDWQYSSRWRTFLSWESSCMRFPYQGIILTPSYHKYVRWMKHYKPQYHQCAVIPQTSGRIIWSSVHCSALFFTSAPFLDTAF